MEILEVCKYMGGWTIEDYRRMPARMRDILHVKIATEGAYQSWKANQKPTSGSNR